MTLERRMALAAALAIAGLVLLYQGDMLAVIAIGYAWLLILTREQP